MDNIQVKRELTQFIGAKNIVENQYYLTTIRLL